MNASYSTSTVLQSAPGSDPVFGQFGGLFVTTLRSLRLQWFLYRAGRRKPRVAESLGDMNAYMLRDIGAPDAMVARAAAAKPLYERSGVPFGLAVVLVSVALAGISTPALAANEQATARSGQAQARVQTSEAPIGAVFAGEYANGAPVYRFPAVVVIGSRKDAATGNLQPCRQTRLAGIKSPA